MRQYAADPPVEQRLGVPVREVLKGVLCDALDNGVVHGGRREAIGTAEREGLRTELKGDAAFEYLLSLPATSFMSLVDTASIDRCFDNLSILMGSHKPFNL